MKKILPILLGFCLLLSCSTGDEYTKIVLNPSGAKSELIVKISTADLDRKSVGYGDNNYVETKITNAVIATFFEDGSLNVIRNSEFSEGAENKVIFSLKSGNIKVHVVANVDVTLFDKVSNEDDFNKVLLTLNQSIIPASGVKVLLLEPEKTTTATIYLERIVSKISLSKVSVNLKANGYSNATFSIDRVFLHNANTLSSPTYIGSNPLSGLNEPSLMNYKKDFFGEYDRHYFYAFEGGLKLIIGGWFKDGNRAAEYLYYPVSINAIHNTHHAISATINGKGVKNPDDTFEGSSTLDLTLKVLAWSEDPIDVIFQ